MVDSNTELRAQAAFNKNESFSQVPVDLTDEMSFKRMLREVIEEIDIITGRRAQDPYVASSQNAPINLTTISKEIAELKLTQNELLKTIELIRKDVTDNANRLPYEQAAQELSIVYRDFDDPVWANLVGKGRFEALGSELINPPYAVFLPGDYTIYTDSYKSGPDGLVQKVILERPSELRRIFYRAGSTFANAVFNDWSEV